MESLLLSRGYFRPGSLTPWRDLPHHIPPLSGCEAALSCFPSMILFHFLVVGWTQDVCCEVSTSFCCGG